MDRKEFESFHCQEAMKWYGWGSPVGITIFLIGVGVVGLLIRRIITG